ncbi:MAG: phage Gp37/Gp68 family protein [Limnochordia bacterium]|nr:phage Gp37/Gp68 family protein [Limnochordia bacterium]MDD4518596.1 phage Gp37/Gp68 family protein [Limnochordia bacterium]
MASISKIEWTEITWNPVTGCSKISEGCRHCYAERMARRLKAMGMHRYRNGFDVTLQPDVLQQPLRWQKPRLVFVNSMSDLFHEDIPSAYIRQVFEVMQKASKHTFQILTKRSKRLRELSRDLAWPPNVWMGVTVEAQEYDYRIEDLMSVPASVRFLSLEPLLGPIHGIPEKVDWVIVGGESGPGARPVDIRWIRCIRDECQKKDMAFFFKQWGGTRRKAKGRTLDGQIWSEMPDIRRCVL